MQSFLLLYLCQLIIKNDANKAMKTAMRGNVASINN